MDSTNNTVERYFEELVNEFHSNKKKTSKVISRELAEKVIEHLKSPDNCTDSQFKHYVRKRGFQVINLGTYGLFDVLIVPISKVIVFFLIHQFIYGLRKFSKLT